MGRSNAQRRILDKMVGINGLAHADTNGLIVVALPSPDDLVRKISSEKEPHVTLLYLGDPGFDRISEDARNVEKAFAKIDRGGTDVLSNHELQSVVNRLNLEQQYSRLMSTPGGKQANELERGHAAVKQILSIGKTVNDVHKFMKSPAGKALKNGFKAAKFGVKVYTNPTGAALDLVRPSNHFTNVG
jgi:hypothetical protein